MQAIRWLLHASPCFFVLMSLLVQSSHGARPSPGELQRRPPAVSVAVAEKQQQLVVVDPRSIAAAGAGRDADVVAVPVMTTTPAGAVGGDRRSRGGDDVRGRSVALVMAQALRHSARAARRALAEAAAAAASSATDGAGPSCHSNNVHITCSPPLQN